MPTDTSAERARQLLESGELEIEGQLTDASNVALRVWVSSDEDRIPAVYKPIRGERPLWDFPDGTLAGREVASYLIAEAGGWDCIPVTALRQDGPLGPGSVQQWVGPLDERDDPDLLRIDAPMAVPDGYLPVLGVRDEADSPLVVSHAASDALRAVALLDVVLNNADRKGSALIVDAGRLYAVDHGLTLHVEDKLRTVLWGFAGDTFEAADLDRLKRLADALNGAFGERLCAVIQPDEVAALRARVESLIRTGRFPEPPEHRHPLPWPLW
ncbi:SCO1664 family protein [Flexivirga meconopsidis]|uniref:SCO1664 family protein n=1 Tax=Flexivirga meconopsidis TaxID=2977121 RepID=UPI00223EB616